MRTWVVKKLRGVDSLRHTNLISVPEMRRIAVRTGFAAVQCRPRRIAAPDRRYPYLERKLMQLYRRLGETRWMRGVLLHLGPAFELRLSRARDS
jgi:hypothetical protein